MSDGMGTAVLTAKQVLESWETKGREMSKSALVSEIANLNVSLEQSREKTTQAQALQAQLEAEVSVEAAIE